MKKDHLIRAITSDGCHQLYIVRATGVVIDSMAIRPLSKKASEYSANMMMLALLRSNNLKEASQLLTFQLDTVSDAKKVMATANSKGEVKGYISNPSAIGDLSSNMLSCTADMGLKTPYHSSVFADGNNIEDVINSYFEQSDQTLLRYHSSLTYDENGDFQEAYALLYHRLPDNGTPSSYIYNEERAHKAIASQGDLEYICKLFFEDEPYEIVSDEPVRFHCDCSKDKFEKLLKTVSDAELEEMANGKEPIVTSCGWCGKNYSFSPEDIRLILEAKKVHK